MTRNAKPLSFVATTMVTIIVAVLLTLSLHAATTNAQTPPSGIDPTDQQPTAKPSLSDVPHPRAINRTARRVEGRSRVETLLRKPVKIVDWDEAPLSEIFEWIRAQAKPLGPLNVVPRWRPLALEGIDEDTPLTLKMEDSTVGAILAETLDQLSGPDPITYQSHGNTIKISTQSDFQSAMHSRIYDIAEIVDATRASRVQPMFAVGQQIHVVRQFVVDGAGVGATTEPLNLGTSLFGDFEELDQNQGDDDDDQEVEDIVNELITVITLTIAPDTWAVNGGPGTIAAFNNQLIIRNSLDVHAQLAGRFHLNR